MLIKRAFYLLRHGQTDWNLEGRYQGHADVALNATGLAQAAAAAERLGGVPIDRIITSPLIRALKTAAIVAERIGKPLHPERDLVERNFGGFDGQVIREVKQRHGLRPEESSQSILPADADSFAEIFDRAPRVVAKWLDAHPSEMLLFVAHGGIFDGLHAHLRGLRSGPESKHAAPYLFAPADTGWSIAEVAWLNCN
jgi:2,3-bisphosphoglycerate-dependent phosphoglycerate mutase